MKSHRRVQRRQSPGDEPIASSQILPRTFGSEVTPATPQSQDLQRQFIGTKPTSHGFDLSQVPVLGPEVMGGARPSRAAIAPAIQRDETLAAPNDIPDHHIILEYIAHHIAYSPAALQDPQQSEILTRAGYDLARIAWRTGRYGFQACLIPPRRDRAATLKPVLAVRGTSTLAGASTDLDFSQVGSNQFLANQEQIQELLKLAGVPVEVTGHSLGGAVAQIIAAQFAGQVSDVITFQAPGINLSTLGDFNNIPEDHRRPRNPQHFATG